jgi:hypothetical protein
MTASQLLVWTALPNGIDDAHDQVLNLSVFLAPQLTATVPMGDAFAPLSLFPDFSDWPGTISSAPDGPITFTVTFDGPGGVLTVPATDVTPVIRPGVDAGAAWRAIFDPDTTEVEPFVFQDYSIRTVHSFPVNQIAAFVSSIYGTIGSISPTDPILLNATLAQGDNDNGYFSASNPTAQQIYEELGGLFPAGRNGDASSGAASPALLSAPAAAFEQLRAFHAPLSDLSYAIPDTPTLDFHQALTGLNNYPEILRLFHLVFDLKVRIPATMPDGNLTVLVTPTWTPTPDSGVTTTNVTPWTAATLTPTTFRPTPQGPDYGNGMLGLNDTTRFSVTDLDTDLAADRLDSLSVALQTGQRSQLEQTFSSYLDENPASTALTVPALRSAGPQVIWTGYAAAGFAGFSGLLDGQKALQSSLTTWQASPSPATLPVIYAEQLMRGHRFDVFTASETAPTWRSLCGRRGRYTFGPSTSHPVVLRVDDEGTVSPGASQKAGTTGPPPTDLWVHESIARWNGWGLCAQRPGRQIDRYTNTTDLNPENMPEAPSTPGPSAPQMAAYFVSPTPARPSLLFPKLRFGSEYQFRARGVDLAGNSVDVTSTDASTATAPFTHYRYEPVLPPVEAGMAPFAPGEATLYLVLLDDQVDPPGTNGRWLFPPRVSELMAEEHGMLDGFSLGSPPDRTDGPSGAVTTYDLIVNYDGGNLGNVTATPNDFSAPLIGTFDDGNQGVPYFTGTPQPWTPWLSDPLSAGPALSGLPGLAAGDVLTPTWNGVWPQLDPIVVTLAAGATSASQFVAPTSSAPGTVEVTLPPAEVALVRVSSALAPGALDVLGVWQWFGASPTSPLATLANQGQVWLLSPFQVLRMVHAVRTPLVPPALGSPVADRTPGSLSVDLDDPKFQVDPKSTSHVDVVAQWTDPYDNPSDPTSDPAEPPPGTSSKRSTVTSGGPAFRLSIPDPTPTGPEAQPLSIVQPEQPFAFAPNEDNRTHQESATHHVGDTLHHLVYYTATGTSRFAELFEQTETTSMTVGTAVTLGSAALGLNGASVEVTIGTDKLDNGVDFSVDESARTVTLLATAARPAGSTYSAQIDYQPTVTVTGEARAVEVLSTARPKAPVISQVVPAWQLEGPSGSVDAGGISVVRTGGFLRVYLDRPWYTSGGGELLGVVTTVTSPSDSFSSTFPTLPQQSWVTMMGIDPINYVEASTTPWPVVPNAFADLADMPEVPYRPPYANPPQVHLAEDSEGFYQVWPYEVAYDGGSGRWYADIAPRPGETQEGTYPPPPGYFIRLALVRFQPYSIPVGGIEGGTVEVSPVVTATFAQPVPDRSVSVVTDTADKTGKTVSVTVTGPAYQGWRSPQDLGSLPNIQYDADNLYAPSNTSIYGADIVETVGTQHTSTMVVEVQVQDEVLNKLGIEGDLAWKTTSAGPVLLPPTFSGEVFVTWGGSGSVGGNPGSVTLPDPVTSTTKMRLRISEIDYYPDDAAPAAVNTSLRRPFVTLIPLN